MSTIPSYAGTQTEFATTVSRKLKECEYADRNGKIISLNGLMKYILDNRQFLYIPYKTSVEYQKTAKSVSAMSTATMQMLIRLINKGGWYAGAYFLNKLFPYASPSIIIIAKKKTLYSYNRKFPRYY